MEIFFFLFSLLPVLSVVFFMDPDPDFSPSGYGLRKKSPILIGIRNTGSHTIGLFIVIIFRLEAKQVSNETLIGTMVS